MTIHIVQYSGGIGSWATAMRVAKRYGTDGLVLLAADTRVEDPDLWRFVADSAAHLGVEPVIVADGRTPWEVFADQHFLGNSRIAPCSVHLKQKPCRAWPVDCTKALINSTDRDELKTISACRCRMRSCLFIGR